MKCKYLLVALFLFSTIASSVFAYEAHIISGKSGETSIIDTQKIQYFYDELNGEKKIYTFSLSESKPVAIGLFVPTSTNARGKYSFRVLASDGSEVIVLDGSSYEWHEYYDALIREYYMQGPSMEKTFPAGDYTIEVYSPDNTGKYILEVGNKIAYEFLPLLNYYWQIPILKLNFFKTSIVEFFLTPFSIALVALLGFLLIFIFFIGFIISTIQERMKHNQAKTLLLTSSGMDMKTEILNLLQKPAYDVNVSFITTASKAEEDASYADTDLKIMREMGFNVEPYDIAGKTEMQVMQELQLKDIIFVEGGNTYYLLQAMRKCNFERVIRNLLKEGIVYVGVSAGSIVAGRTIQTAEWKGVDKNIAGVKNFKGLNLVPFDIFVHYKPEHAELIQQKIQNPKKRQKELRILADGQALLVQGKDSFMIGQGEEVII